jgi:hypothetical protein
MSAIREAVLIPIVFLTTALAAGAQFGPRVTLAAPPLFALVLAVMLIGTLVRSGALAPPLLMHASRSGLANANGLVVLVTLFAAAAQVLAMLTPRSGLPFVLVSIFLFVLLFNTWVATPDAVRLLRSLAVTLGSALLLKFVVLSGLSSPAGSRTGRLVTALFDVATMGTVAQAPEPPIAGYTAFLAVALFLAGVALLPRQRRSVWPTTELSLR